MKKIIFCSYFILSIVMVNAQSSISSTGVEYQRSANTFTSAKKEAKTSDVKTIYTWKDSKRKEYPIYVSKNGSCYIIKISSKNNKEYKQYLGAELSKEVCREIGRKYKGKQKK